MSIPMKEFKVLHKLVDKIFREAYNMGWSWAELADKANLAIPTVYRLGNYDTMYPRAATVLQLAQAVGFQVTFTKIANINKRVRLKIA